MRILKKKLALSAQAKDQQNIPQQDQQHQNSTEIDPVDNSSENTLIKPEKEEKNRKKTVSSANSTKTIVKNYGKAIASFAMNKISKPYLNPLLSREGIRLKEFVNYICTAKESIEGIDTFRALLLVKPTDNKKEASYKRIFKDIAEVFIKYFSVNWIFSGKMANKDAHLKFRFKMLRRIRNPEIFTYLK